MEEVFLRVCVVLVSMLCLKDHTVYEEQGNITMDLQEREHVLQKEGAKLEQEMQSVAMEPPQVSQSHHRLTKGEGQESDVHPFLPNGKGTPNGHQIPSSKDQDIRQHTSLTKDKSDELQTDKDVGEVFKQASNVPVPAGHDQTKETMSKGNELMHQQDGESVQKTEDPHHVNDTETLSDVQSSSASNANQVETTDIQTPSKEDKEIPQNEKESFFQWIINGFRGKWFQASQNEDPSLDSMSSEGAKQLQMQKDLMTGVDEIMPEVDSKDSLTAKETPHADQKPSSSSQEQNQELLSENAYTWYLWKGLSLFSVIRLLRKLIARKSKTSGKPSSNMDSKTISLATSISAKISVLDHKVLSCFYEQCVQIPPSTQEQVCDFVEGFVDELLEAAKRTSIKANDLQIGDFVGVGSLYEFWATGKTIVCDLYVRIIAPNSYSFDFELNMPGSGRIKLLKVQNSSNGCPCSVGIKDDDDMLCLIHSHNETKSVVLDAFDGPLCAENTPYLAKTQVVRWFRKTIRKAWEENSHKYEFELAFRNQAAPGALKVRLRSGQVILFNITPVVQIQGSDLYLVSYLSSDQRTSDTAWPISLASYEKALLQHFKKSLPYDSCHIQCLQILSFLHKNQNTLTGKCGLTNYHLKLTLLHVLFATKPTEWKLEHLAGRLTDMLIFLQQSLEACRFHHSLVGNSLVPSSIGLPKGVKLAKPTNLFLPEISDPELHRRTLQHLQELVKNTPVLIQEYVSV
ncbi:inositol 1,4,5-trisphosphate receptor-interacting protein [Hoplias malabaricus]|uniref:inositol 1,4,5-trisphosphate receptor-interacting protein n=1 Tax=Hoplias malabaricus TaxID=27720 RepID=UPI00346368BF